MSLLKYRAYLGEQDRFYFDRGLVEYVQRDALHIKKVIVALVCSLLVFISATVIVD